MSALTEENTQKNEQKIMLFLFNEYPLGQILSFSEAVSVGL